MKLKLTLMLVFLVLLLAACHQVVDSVKPTVIPASPAPKEPESGVAETQVFESYFEESPCPFQIPGGHIEGETILCGYVVVPEDHAKPGGSTIRLATAIFKSHNQPGQPDPLIFLSGGPGEKTVAYVAPLAEHLSGFNQDRDLVFFDQRGVGLSEPALECPEFVDALFDILEEPVAEKAQRIIFESTLACKDRLVAEGTNLAAYTTAQNAADVEDIRVAMGYERVNLFGGSYGSLLAQVVMREHPDHIRSVIIDSTVPVGKSLLIDIPTTAVKAALHLMESCAADQACNTAYPDLENVLYDTVEQLNEQPIPVTLANPLDGQNHEALLSGEMVFGNLVFFLYQTPIIPTLPQAIYNVANGDYDLMIQLSSRKLAAYDALSRGMNLSVLCTEDLVGRTPEDYLEIRLQMPPALAGRADPEDFIEYGFFGICEHWPVEPADPAIKEPVTSEISTLVLGGEFDPVTPPEYGRLVAETLRNSYFYEFPSIGHSVAVADECAREITAAFLDAPMTEPDASCRERLKIEFVLPIDFDHIPMEAVTIPEFGIQALVPEGWTQVKPEYYISPDTTIELVIKENTQEDPQDFLKTWGASEPMAELESHVLTWQLYESRLPDHNVAGYAATAPSAGGFFMVLIVTTPAQQEQLYDSVFIPILEAFTYDDALKSAGDIDEAKSAPPVSVPLIPYESKTFGIRGLVPEGWSEVQPGIYARRSSAGDQTLVIQKSYPDMTMDELLAILLPSLQLESLPEPVEVRENGAFDWILYQTTISAPGVGTFMVELALTELDGIPYLVILQAEVGEYAEAAMREGIFIPAVDAFSMLE